MEKQIKKIYKKPLVERVIIDKNISITMLSPGGNPPGPPSANNQTDNGNQNPYKA